MHCSLFSVILAFGALSQAAFNHGALNAFHHEHPGHLDQKRHPVPPTPPTLEKRAESKFLNERSQKFVVDGTSIPEVDFDIGESYAGLLPISQTPGEERQLYFWFFPSANPDAGEEVVIW